MITEEFSEGKDYVKCCLCGECMKQLHNHIVKVHHITIDKYRELFPDEKIGSDASTEAKASANRMKYSCLENHHYSKRFVYLLPDGTYASKTDVYKRVWNTDFVKPEHIVSADEAGYVKPSERLEKNGVEGEDYVKCRICGEAKGSISQHIRKFHNMTVKQYLAAYPNAEIHCGKVKRAFSEASKKKWQTQFSNGTFVPAKKKEPKKDDGITKELLEKYFMDGCNCSEIGRIHNVSGSTVVNRCKQFVIDIPSVAVLKIRFITAYCFIWNHYKV